MLTFIWSHDAREGALPGGWLSVAVDSTVWMHLYAVLFTRLQVGQIITPVRSREKLLLQVKNGEITN